MLCLWGYFEFHSPVWWNSAAVFQRIIFFHFQDPYYHDIRTCPHVSTHPNFTGINSKQQKRFLTCNSASSTSSLATLAKWWRRQVNCVNLMVNWSSKWSHALGMTPFILCCFRWCYPVELLQFLFRICIICKLFKYVLHCFNTKVHNSEYLWDLQTAIKSSTTQWTLSSRCARVN